MLNRVALFQEDIMKNDELDKVRKYWNFRAESFNDEEIPSVENNSFLYELSKRGILGGKRAIDIACGTGNYTLALGRYFEEAVGCDISDEMISYAEERKRKAGADNVSFKCDAWQRMDVSELGWEKKFDLAIAHLAPAVDSIETLEKMRLVSSGWCAVTKTVSRRSPIRDEVNRICSVKSPKYGQSEMLKFLDYLWSRSIAPEIFYEREEWKTSLTEERAAENYIRTMSLDRGFENDEIEGIKNYFKSISSNGIVDEKTDVIICTIYWNEKTYKKSEGRQVFGHILHR